MAIHTYERGDLVLIRNEVTTQMAEYFNSERTRYLGRIVRINRMEGSAVFYIDGDVAFRTDAIQRRLTEEELEEQEAKEREKIEILKETYKDVYFTADRVGEMAIDIFGEKMVDIVDTKNESFDVVILFPEITLTNTDRGIHDIKDLYVNISVSPIIGNIGRSVNYKADVRLTGRRGKFTLKEFENSYIHSHLPAGGWDFESFCLGSSPIKMVVEETKMELSEDAWMKLFLSLPNYVKWESLEGGPHFKMRELSLKHTVGNADIEKELIRIIKGIPKRVWEINDSLTVIPSHPELFRYFNSFSEIRSMSGYSDEQHKAEMERQQKILESHYKKHPLIWKGEEILPVLIEEQVEQSGRAVVERAVVEKYCQILGKKSKTFLKTKNYNNAKHSNYKKVFGERTTVQQANVNTNEAIAE